MRKIRDYEVKDAGQEKGSFGEGPNCDENGSETARHPGPRGQDRQKINGKEGD
ncbi:hypothetical protein M2650_09005 [Luteimonas sp. SX5]|uniref:General stress protein n=1 Tax=Luteimonas galliterrae TaxID=2940486 RepID=A0ABT0MIQ9_9GAMM|nr:hypothetical protein [Luteimonas galliterrae]